MPKQIKNGNNKKKPIKKKVKSNSTKRRKIYKKHLSKRQIYILIVVIFLIGVLLIFSSYAWFSTALNVRIKQFDMIVSRNSGLTISFDAVNYDSFLDLTSNSIIEDVDDLYPNHINQWAQNGLIPVSTNGIMNSNDSKFTIFATGGVHYKNKKKDIGYIKTAIYEELESSHFTYFIAFDLFIKNKTGSPASDNLYIGKNTKITVDGEVSEEMIGLVNSLRIGFLKIGSVPLDATVNQVQNISCNNECVSVIYEPNAFEHSDLSIERALKYSLNLKKNESFPTYGCIKEGGPLIVNNTVSGSTNINKEYFKLQETRTEKDIDDALFSLPNGITKLRVYVWVEGQDIDSLETDSDGANITIALDLNKDTEGYDVFN